LIKFDFRNQKLELSKIKDSAFWRYYILSLIKCGRKGLFVPLAANDSFVTPDILALIDAKTPKDHQYNDKFYSSFLQNLSKGGKHDVLANLLLDDLDKRWEEWASQSNEWLKPEENGQVQFHKAFQKFLAILRTIHMIGSLYFLDQQYEDCYLFISDHLKEIKDINNLTVLGHYHLEYINLRNEYQKILCLYLNCLTLMIKTNFVKDLTPIHRDLDHVINALCETAHPNEEASLDNKFSLNFQKDLKETASSKHLGTIELLHGISKLLIGDLSQAKIYLIQALKSDCESYLVKKALSLYYVLHERKASVIGDYNLAVFDEYKICRDYDLDSTSNMNKNRPIYLDLLGNDSSSYSLIEYLEAYNKCENKEERRKLITRAAMYLNDINIWFVYCVELLQNEKERSPQRLYQLINILYIKVIKEITNITSSITRESYNKILRKAIKLSFEIGVLFEKSTYIDKEKYEKEFQIILEEINTIGLKQLGTEKLENYKKRLGLFYDLERLRKTEENTLSQLFKTDISALVFLKVK